MSLDFPSSGLWASFLGGTCEDCGKQTTSPDESQHLHLERPRARARQGRSCCCRSIVVEEVDHREPRAPATSAHTYVWRAMRHADLGVERGVAHRSARR
eukprot:scaffold881_cov123-Isochrysis_galbana.AAC.13